MARYLADTSAWNRSGAVAARWADLVARNDVALCAPVWLELLWSATSPADYGELSLDLTGFPSLSLAEGASDAALRTQARLARRSQHRGPTPTDLLIAAIAEVHGVTLLHYDRHFETIASVTGQPVEWLARRGSLD